MECGGGGGAVASAFFPECGCGLLVLGVLLLFLSVASPVTRLVNISGPTSQARLLQIKFNECVFVSPAALHSQVEAPCLKLSKFPSFLAPTRKMPLLTPGELWHGLTNCVIWRDRFGAGIQALFCISAVCACCAGSLTTVLNRSCQYGGKQVLCLCRDKRLNSLSSCDTRQLGRT